MSRRSLMARLDAMDDRIDAGTDRLEAVVEAAFTRLLFHALESMPWSPPTAAVLTAAADDDPADLRVLARRLQRDGVARGAAAIVAAADQVAAETGQTRQDVMAAYNRFLAATVVPAENERAAEERRAAGLADDGGVRVPPTTDPGTMFDNEEFDRLVEDTEELLFDQIRTEYGVAGLSWNVRPPGVVEAAARMAGTLGEFSEAARANLTATMTEAVTKGWSVDRAAARLVASGTFERPEARMWSNTLMVAASNHGSYGVFETIAVEGDMAEWVAAQNAKTRPTHRAASGQRVPMGSMFTVGGSQGKFPGDLSLPMKERARCRCRVILVDKNDLDLPPIYDGSKAQED